MADSIYAGISQEMLCLQKAADFVDAAENGALTMFIGRVRNHNMGKSVNAVSYDVFAPLACNVFHTLCAEARAQFGEHLRLYVEHYKGTLTIGGISVIIAAGSPHRDESFKACRYLIEQLKIRAPIWKQEHYADGDSEWVRGHALCGHCHG